MKLYPILRYRDARRANDWLCSAFGLEPNALHEGEGGRVEHGQLRWGDDMLMFGSAREDGVGVQPGGTSLYLSCDDPDALFERATGAGAEVVRPLQDMEYGSREFSVADFEGNVWSFGTYDPAAA